MATDHTICACVGKQGLSPAGMRNKQLIRRWSLSDSVKQQRKTHAADIYKVRNCLFSDDKLALVQTARRTQSVINARDGKKKLGVTKLIVSGNQLRSTAPPPN